MGMCGMGDRAAAFKSTSPRRCAGKYEEVIDQIRAQLLTFELPEAPNDARCTECQLLHHLPAGPLKCPAQGEPIHGQRCLSDALPEHRLREESPRPRAGIAGAPCSCRRRRAVSGFRLEAVDALVVLGGAQITTQALDACVRRGVRVAALQMSGAVRFVVSGPTSGNVHLRTAQFEAVMDDTRSLAVAKAIVAAKLQNSSGVVGRWSRDEKDPLEAEQLAARSAQIRERIPRLAEAGTPDHVRGVEGDAARIYFRAVGQAVASSDLEFSGRTRRPPRDPVNALLGFCLRHARDRVHRRCGERWPGLSDGFLPPSSLGTTVSRA